MNVYEIMTSRIVEMLEKGSVPWQLPWDPSAGMPCNLITQRPYRGINVFILTVCGYASPYWVTFNQAREKGGHVKKGEKGTMIVFWKMRRIATGAEEDSASDNESKENRGKPRPLLRYYIVFNLEQTDGLSAPKAEGKPRVFNPIEDCESLVQGMPDPPAITHGHPYAKYKPFRDAVEMPARESFRKAEEYYSTLFHELGHATGHPKRLGRKSITDLCPFGSTNYSREELVAEMTATFLCGTAGIANQTVENSAAYIAGWRRALEGDPKAVVIAAAQAQKAADWILNKKPAERTEQEAA